MVGLKKWLCLASGLFMVSIQASDESLFENLPMTVKAGYISIPMLMIYKDAMSDDVTWCDTIVWDDIAVAMKMAMLGVGMTTFLSSLDIAGDLIHCSVVTVLLDRYVCMLEKYKNAQKEMKRIDKKVMVKWILSQMSNQRFCL